MRQALVAACIALLGCAGDASAQAPLSFAAPAANGVVELGRDVPYRLDGPACPGAEVAAVVSVAGRAMQGEAARGCSGVVTIPSAAQAVAAGWSEGAPI